MTNDMVNGPDAGLWRRARAAWAEREGADDMSDPLLLAAYIDGTLGARERERVEAELLSAGAALDLLVSARAALAEPSGPAPDAVVARAQALVRKPAAARGGRLAEWWAEAFQPMIWSGVAAALLLAAVSGFELGRVGVERLAALDQTMTEDVRLVMGTARDEIL